jgi:small neutral amino acid transporter SnatA (MarC family)
MLKKINPFNTSNPMSFRDAATIATIVAVVVWIMTFLASASIDQLRGDIVKWVFDAVKSLLIAWASTFMTLAGLDQYMQGKVKQ